MTTNKSRLPSIDKARKNTHSWIGKITGWVMLILSIPASIIGWLGVHFSLSLKWFVGMGCIGLSLWWSTENYYIGYGGGSLGGDILSGGIQGSVFMGFFLTCLVQFFQMESARERSKARALGDVDSFKADKITVFTGYFFYTVEFLVWVSTFSVRSQGGLVGTVVACLIGWVSIWGFETGVKWIESKD